MLLESYASTLTVSPGGARVFPLWAEVGASVGRVFLNHFRILSEIQILVS